MKKLLAVFALTSAAMMPSHAAVVYTSSAAFLQNVQPGYYTETFDGNRGPATSLDYAGNGFSYTATSSERSGAYETRSVLSTTGASSPLIITFTGAAVNAIGGNFFTTNGSGSFRPIEVSIALSDGTSATFTPVSIDEGYRGFTTDVFITSLTINTTLNGFYPTVDDLTVGRAVDATAVPEPASLAVMGAGMAGLMAVRRRRKA